MGRYLQLTVGEPSAGSALGHNSCFPLVHMFILIFIQHMFIPILQQGRMMLTFVCCRVCMCSMDSCGCVCVCLSSTCVLWMLSKCSLVSCSSDDNGSHWWAPIAIAGSLLMRLLLAFGPSSDPIVGNTPSGFPMGIPHHGGPPCGIPMGDGRGREERFMFRIDLCPTQRRSIRSSLGPIFFFVLFAWGSETHWDRN